LREVSDFIKQHHHLPGIPTDAEIKENGVSLGDMQAKLLAKIEELTLHMIRAEERNNQLEQQNRDLQLQTREMQARIARLETNLPSRNEAPRTGSAMHDKKTAEESADGRRR